MGCDEGRERHRGGEEAARGGPTQGGGEHEREGAGGCVDAWQGYGSGTDGQGPWIQFPAHRSGCAGRETPGTRQEGTTGDWEEAPRRRS